MPEIGKSLLDIATQYSSQEEFRKANLPKYLLAKKKGILSKAFPKESIQETLKGIYYLYKGLKVIYIGSSVINCMESVESHKETIQFDSYKIFQMSNESDIAVLSLYLANKYKPRYNTNIGRSELSFKIEEASSILGEPTKGEA